MSENDDLKDDKITQAYWTVSNLFLSNLNFVSKKNLFEFLFLVLVPVILNFWHLIKFGESFSLSSLLNQSQTYQDNPCGVYPDLSSFTGSGVIQISVICIKQSAPTQVHITRLYWPIKIEHT
ncbi:hypothetical protein HKD37_20G055922 [Glycine soja]